MSSLPITIASWEKNRRETVRIQLGEYQGRHTVDIRTWWTDESGELRPSKSGITLAVRHLPNLSLAVDAALAKAISLELLVAEGSEVSAS